MSLVLGSLLPAFMKCPLKIKIGQIKTTLKGNASSLQYIHTHTPPCTACHGFLLAKILSANESIGPLRPKQNEVF